MKRRVLIVTPFFAPQSHAAVFRAYKLAKYLPSLGWSPHVVTVDTNYAYNEDASLLADLPSEVMIHRARYVEPSPRGLGYVTGLADRRFQVLKRQGEYQTAQAAAPAQGASTLRQRAAQSLRRALRVPDAYWPWFWPATQLALQVSREHDIGLVLTSADPYTTHAIGLVLQRRGLRWVADLRDPHTHCHHTSARSAVGYAVQRELERAAAERADAVTVAARSIALILKETYALRDDSRLHFIPTGLDLALLGEPRAPSDEPPYLIFAGEYLPDYGDVFFRLFAHARKDEGVRARGYRIRVVGRREVNEPRIAPHAARWGVSDYVDFIDHVPQHALYPMLQGAEFAVLCYGENARWWCLPAKLVDYLALRKPVLAIVPNPSEARARLEESGLGVFLDGVAGETKLTQALLAGGGGYPANEQQCARYEAQAQVRSFCFRFRVVESMTVPRVSVIVTTYNRAAALRRCVASILQQSLTELELIVVDDASQDASADVVASFADSRLHYHRLEQNAGAPARPRNVGASLARAPLLFVFDSDDTMLPNCLAAFVAAFEANPRLGLAWSWKNLLSREGEVVGVEKRDRLATEPRLPLALVYTPGANGLAIRRTVFDELGGFDEALPRMDDYELVVRFAARTDWELTVLPVVTMNVHCDVGGHISANPARTLRAREHVLSKHAHLFAAHPREHARHLYQVAQLRLAVRGDKLGFLRALAQSLLRDPVPRRALSAWRALPLAPTKWRRDATPPEDSHRKRDDG